MVRRARAGGEADRIASHRLPAMRGRSGLGATTVSRRSGTGGERMNKGSIRSEAARSVWRPSRSSRQPARAPARRPRPARPRRRRSRRQHHDRHLEPGRGRQRLARGDDLLGQGPGAQAAARSPSVTVIHREHRRGRPAGRHPRPDRRRASTRSSSTRPTRTALNPAIEEAIDAGIAVVAIDAPVTAPGAYNLSNDQENYAYLGAKWLFEQLGGKGAVVYMRGIAGHPADTDRDTGFKKALAENPGIKVVEGDRRPTGTRRRHRADQRDPVERHQVRRRLDVRHRQRHRRRAQDGQPPFVPIVGADNSGFVTQLLDRSTGLDGRGRDQPAAVGGAGVALGAAAPRRPEACRRRTSHVTPELWDNTTDAGKAELTAAADPGSPGHLAARPDRSRTGRPTPSDRRRPARARARADLPGPIAISHGDAGSRRHPRATLPPRHPPHEDRSTR